MTNRYDEKERRIHCAFSEKCGGCDYAGMKYDNELAVKQKYIEELFGEYVKVDDIVGMYRPIHYRNKVHAVVGLDDSRNVIAGTYEENSHRIVDTSDCMIEDSQCTDIIKDIKELIASFKYQPYDEDAGKGMIRHILLRKGFSTKEIMLLLQQESHFHQRTIFLRHYVRNIRKLLQLCRILMTGAQAWCLEREILFLREKVISRMCCVAADSE